MFFPIVADQTLEPRTPHPVSRPSTAQQSCKTKQEVSNDFKLSQIPGLFQPGAGKWLDRVLDLYCQLPRAPDAMLSVLSVRLSERIEIPFCSDLRSIITTITSGSARELRSHLSGQLLQSYINKVGGQRPHKDVSVCQCFRKGCLGSRTLDSLVGHVFLEAFLLFLHACSQQAQVSVSLIFFFVCVCVLSWGL